MKLLKSSIHDLGYWEVKSDLEPWAKGNKYGIEQLPVNDIWASVPKAEIHRGKEFYRPLKKDIQKNGLRWPIMVVKATREDVKYQKAKWQQALCDLPFWMAQDMSEIQLVVWGGSNRLYAARELGYTHIDCAILPDFESAHRLQKVMREEYHEVYYHGDTDLKKKKKKKKK